MKYKLMSTKKGYKRKNKQLIQDALRKSDTGRQSSI